jgi:hypothetical protein
VWFADLILLPSSKNLFIPTAIGILNKSNLNCFVVLLKFILLARVLFFLKLREIKSIFLMFNVFALRIEVALFIALQKAI